MAFNARSDDDEVMSEINMTPLVDVMLVLLIIFIVAMPIVQHAVKLNLPQATTKPQDVNIKHITLVIDASGQVTWDGRPVDAVALSGVAQAAAEADSQVQLHVRADKATPYEKVAQVMAAVQNAGLSKVGLITTPAH
ncbi:Biopolymer transport protein ExbD [Ephemeroptericola cinctiostellae]|uniref:Biopolymer transport protein ExbD n=1 Tax=Ephemeroptericola cinctiostellae TaxID=2268024 RepID=A0A345D9C7_9BURK|nr:biopolymer transporter ExbD [Ephemeroptericola cinctiostellae]AXF84965.1 Biopolymer transport protein ExbD [Ephemeroptericola cinctiostellae]